MNPPDDIHSWLGSIGLGELAAVFERNQITPEVLKFLTADDLREMGIISLGQRKQLLAGIAALSTSTVSEALPTPVPLPVRLKPAPPTRRAVAPKPVPEPVAQDPVLPPPVAPIAPVVPKYKRKAFSAGFLTISICLHLVVAVGAGYWVVQRIEAKRKLQFASGPPTANPSKRALEHKVSLQKKRNAGGSPAQARRIAVSGLAAKITLPEMPSVPTTSTQFVAGRMAGMGGAGFGSGLGFGNGSGMGVGGAGAGGLGLTMFGARGGAGLIGTFYDLKRDAAGKPNGVTRNRELYQKVLKGFTSPLNWKMPANVACYTGKSKLIAKAFIFPAIQDDEAGKAFNEPGTGPGMWIAHYSGSVKVPVSGRYRFVGWGDNLLAVRFGSKIVLDASDVGYLATGDNRGERGNVSFPKKEAATPVFAGSWITMTAGTTMRMEVLLGDEGGIYCAGLLIEKEGDTPGTGKGGVPEISAFLTAPLGSEEKRLYGKHVSGKVLDGIIFNAVAGNGSPLDVLQR